MSFSYATIREMVVQGVIRAAATVPKKPLEPPPLDRIRAIFDASFFTVNAGVAEAFAARNDKRELLRTVQTLTFTAGSAPLPTEVLKEYMADATLSVTSTPTSKYGFRKYPDYIRGSDPRLGAWTSIGEVVLATKPAANGGGALSGAATFSSINSPAVPASESATFVAADDYYDDFINAMVNYILGSEVVSGAV